MVVGVRREDRCWSVLPLRAQPQRFGPGSAALPVTSSHQDVGQGNDLWRRPVVADQLDHGRLRVTERELQKVPGRRAGEGVDGLGRVPDHAYVVSLTHPEVQQPLLERVDVLVLVDHEVVVLRAHDAGDIVALRKDADGQQQHVLEVDNPALGLDLLVGLQHPGHGGGVEAGRVAARATCGGGVSLGRQQTDLGPLNLGGKVTYRSTVELQAQS